MGEDTTNITIDFDIDSAIDGETIDLFAFMNSTVVELQMEMELLDTKEYQKDDWNSNDDDDDDGTRTDADSGKEQHTTEDDLPAAIVPSAPRLPTTPAPSRSDTAHGPIGSPPFDRTTLSVEDNSEHCDSELETTTVVTWQAVKPIQVGDNDYAPISDYCYYSSSLEPARVGDQDYTPVSDFTTAAEPLPPLAVVAVALEPATIGDRDYAPISDYTISTVAAIAATTTTTTTTTTSNATTLKAFTTTTTKSKAKILRF